jgi:hypothetical protein
MSKCAPEKIVEVINPLRSAINAMSATNEGVAKTGATRLLDATDLALITTTVPNKHVRFLESFPTLTNRVPVGSSDTATSQA